MAGEEASPQGDAPLSPVAEAPGAAVVAEAAAVVEAAPEGAETPVEAAPETAPAVEAETPSADAAPAEGDKPPADAAPIEPEPVKPVYQTFNLPEGFQAEAEQIEAFTGVLGKYGLTQEAGQELMDLHASSLKATGEQLAQQLAQQQQDVFAETRRGWVRDFEKQAGNRRDTILNDAKWAITELVPDEKARKALWGVLGFTGAGDHPAVINAFAASAKRLREREAPPPPVPPKGQPQSKAERRYNKPT